MDKQYRICTQCRIHHYENCETCFGFGVYKSRRIVKAFDALYRELDITDTKPCPECGSTVKGIT